MQQLRLSSTLSSFLSSRSFNKYKSRCCFITKKKFGHSSGTAHTGIILTGATATGKSSVAEYLCTHFDVDGLGPQEYEIVVADSIQVIKHLNIGANKPSRDVMEKIPHHLVNLHEPGTLFSAGEYCRAATDVVLDILRRGKTPLIVGGNTMWIDWLVRGAPSAPKSSEKMKIEAAEILEPYFSKVKQSSSPDSISLVWNQAANEVENRKRETLSTQELDNHAVRSLSMKVARNDWYRLHRLLEIILSIKLTKNNQDNEFSQRFQGLAQEIKSTAGIDLDLRCFFLGGERIRLYKSIDRRCEEMLKNGLLQEVTDLCLQKKLIKLPRNSSGYALNSHQIKTADEYSSQSSPIASSSIGYRQSIDYLLREDFTRNDKAAMLEFLQRFFSATRNYAKRQLHWYRKDNDFLWIHALPGKEKKSILESLAREIHHWSFAVSRSRYENNLSAQVGNARLLAESSSGKSDLTDRFFGMKGRSGESFVLRSCEGALNRNNLRRYSGKTSLSDNELDHLCKIADECRDRLQESLQNT